MGRLHFDTTELRELELDLSGAPGRIQRKAPKVMGRGARAIHRSMTVDATGHRHLAYFQFAVGMTRLDSLGLSYEIGFDKEGQGKLANIIVFGSVNNAPVYDFDSAWRRHLPSIINDLGDAGESSVLDVQR